VKAAIAAQEGGSEGVYTVNKTFTAHVSGDYIPQIRDFPHEVLQTEEKCAFD